MDSVILDYGHGGTDPGACSENYKESEWNLDTGKACKKKLERHNVVVYETRTANQTLSLTQRANIANQTNAKYLVSIHHNAGKMSHCLVA